MSESQRPNAEMGTELITGVLVILLVGAGLGIGYNIMQHRGNPTRAVAWLRQERKLASIEELTAADPASWVDSSATSPTATAPDPHAAPAATGSNTGSPPAPTTSKPPAASISNPTNPTVKTGATTTDPIAAPVATGTPPAAEPPAPRPAISLPHIPDTRDPFEAQLATVKKFYDAGAAVFVDSRSRQEYAEKHIAGSENLPFDDTFKEPTLISSFQSRGKPVIIYCGGGDCELSKNLAYALIEAGHRKVLVFMGGLPDWEKAGYPLATGVTP